MTVIKATLLTVFVICAGVSALTQSCPSASPSGALTETEVQLLDGKLIFHDGIRKWFELKLEHAQCGQNSIQLIQTQHNSTALEVFRGCRVQSQGALGLSATGYYSLDVYQSVDKVQAASDCQKKSPFPDYSKTKPDKSIRSYRVEMTVNYRPGDHPIIFHASNGGKPLTPWQAYASYFLTGGFVLYGNCGEGFVVNKVFGDAKANPSQFDGKAAFNPENAAAAGKQDLRLGYTCVRQR